ncbi:hypothetical protein PV367_02320 [Streptomyces europaeiscabiei]|uniref:Uncharacterized protein n=1 Tax=Streptomyces europaeiscabiei TaxID=146819 RepID=A0AAJ2PJF7_9ACTN|nr:hypothetical protein [Streptomyces europaeiscabiei]MDX3128658.1 hypothetical protein [Streptomyces europaeiscabiei]
MAAQGPWHHPTRPDREGPGSPGRYTATHDRRTQENKESYLRNGQTLEQDWPLASGVVEDACLHLIAG